MVMHLLYKLAINYYHYVNLILIVIVWFVIVDGSARTLHAMYAQAYTSLEHLGPTK